MAELLYLCFRIANDYKHDSLTLISSMQTLLLGKTNMRGILILADIYLKIIVCHMLISFFE